ncbi:hypothetical protein [Ignicoccus hospitalis]|uniref:Uncharacterized protein n=1 Tax=Ignicoccus hospitalis (strain KIN4/I / DSM 18386 / JCM 14125) TaxID=453591 RepID=A8A8D8_IGNH4|nr:hypothetical protein [Ignicoccus hospitalis]ABU81190.1 hypothetical protein Igni_0006 [Ignicoccus hospitalis KIN4/I]HIH90620.1 hypothetical protein [Desulfurococcaceae archaeon]
MSSGLTFQGRAVPEEGQASGEQRLGITKITRIRLFGRWFPALFWARLLDEIRILVGDDRLVSIRSFRTPRGVILTDVDIAGELDPDTRLELEKKVLEVMDETKVNPRRFLKIEVRERPATLAVSQD